MSAPLEFTLTTGERINPLWHKISRYLDRRLDRARKRNDQPLSPEDTALVRGEIKALKGLMALGQELPPVDGDANPLTDTRAGL